MTIFWVVSVSVSKNLVSERKSRYRSRKILSRKESLGIGIGKFGLGKKVSVSVSENLVSEKKSRYWYRKNLSRIKSLGLGIGQNFGLVTQCNPPIQCQSIPNPCQSNVNLSPIRQANVNPGPIHQSNVNPSTIHVNPMSIYHRTANPMSILDQSNNSSASHHPSPIRQSITNPPIHHQSVAIQVSSHSNLIKRQFVANPADPANPVPIRYRSDH